MSYLAIDFGGTRTRVAWYDENLVQCIRDEMLSRVEDGQETVISRMIEFAKRVVPADGQLKGIGVAAPGPLDPHNGVIYHAKTLPGWSNTPLATFLQDAFQVPIKIDNDANLAALAEFRMGAGQGANPLVYLTLSTGIGGGLIIDGNIFRGWSGLAIEPGHINFRIPDGSIRRLEEVASGTGIGKLAQERLQQQPEINSSLRGRDKFQITGEDVGTSALQGDVFALSIIKEASMYLGLGIVNIIHLYSPEAIVFGGSMSQLGDLLFASIEKMIEQRVLDARFVPQNLLRVAHFGDDVCLLGASLLIQETVI